MDVSWTIEKAEHRRILESPLACKEAKPVNPKGEQSWIFIGRTGAEAEAPVLWPLDVKNRLLGKDPDDGKDWRQEEKGMTENEMVGWHHWLNGHEFEQALGVGDGQGNLACCSPWGCKGLDTTEWTDWLIGTMTLRFKLSSKVAYPDQACMNHSLLLKNLWISTYEG